MLLVSFFSKYCEVVAYSFVSLFGYNCLDSSQNGCICCTRLFESSTNSSEIPMDFLFTDNVCHVYTSHCRMCVYVQQTPPYILTIIIKQTNQIVHGETVSDYAARKSILGVKSYLNHTRLRC